MVGGAATSARFILIVHVIASICGRLLWRSRQADALQDAIVGNVCRKYKGLHCAREDGQHSGGTAHRSRWYSEGLSRAAKTVAPPPGGVMSEQFPSGGPLAPATSVTGSS